MTCKAIREGDQLVCGRCGLQWDIDDPDRPQCLTDDEIVEVVEGIPYNPATDGVELMGYTQSLLNSEPDHAVGTEAIKEMRQVITPEKKERLHHDK